MYLTQTQATKWINHWRMECPNHATGASPSTTPKRSLTSETIESNTRVSKRKLEKQAPTTFRDTLSSDTPSLSQECETLLKTVDLTEPTLSQEEELQNKPEITAESLEDGDSKNWGHSQVCRRKCDTAWSVLKDYHSGVEMQGDFKIPAKLTDYFMNAAFFCTCIDEDSDFE